MEKRTGSLTYILVVLSIVLVIIFLILVYLFYNYSDQILNKRAYQDNNGISSYSYDSRDCKTLLVPYTERETYYEKVPIYNMYFDGYDYGRDDLFYKVWVDQENFESERNELTEIVTIKIENRDNDDGYFDVTVVFSPEGESKVSQHKKKFIREDDSEKFIFEYEHDEDVRVGFNYDVDSQSEIEFRYGSDLRPYPYSHMFYRNDYVYDYDNCFHGYCKPSQVVSYREVPRIKMVTKYKEVVICN